MNIRRYAVLTLKSQNINVKMSKIWNFMRKYNDFLALTYNKIKIYAENKNITIPKPFVNMDYQKDNKFWDKIRGKN